MLVLEPTRPRTPQALRIHTLLQRLELVIIAITPHYILIPRSIIHKQGQIHMPAHTRLCQPLWNLHIQPVGQLPTQIVRDGIIARQGPRALDLQDQAVGIGRAEAHGVAAFGLGDAPDERGERLEVYAELTGCPEEGQEGRGDLLQFVADFGVDLWPGGDVGYCVGLGLLATLYICVCVYVCTYVSKEAGYLLGRILWRLAG